MDERPGRRPIKLRRTIAPSGQHTPLGRSLFGLSRKAADRILSELAERSAAQAAALHRQIQAELIEQARLRQEIEAARQRAEALKAAVGMLEEGLRREHERAPLTQRMLDQELGRQEAEHAARLRDLRFEEVRLQAEIRRERTALSELADSLRRALSQGRQ